MNLQAEASSLKKGETLLDTANNLNAMKPDCFVMRHSSSGAADFVARHLEIPVVNAGDGTHEHPVAGPSRRPHDSRSQRLARKSQCHHPRGHCAFPGSPLQHPSTQENSAADSLSAAPPCGFLANSKKSARPALPSAASITLKRLCEDADVIIVLRVQTERLLEPSLSHNDYILLYQLNAARMKLAKPDALILHPGPINRGTEITPEVADGPQSAVLEQVTNGVAVRMAILYLLTTGATEGSHPALEEKTDSKSPIHTPRNLLMLLIKNGRVLDPATKTDAARDILLDGERIKEIAPAGKLANPRDSEVFDASGLIVAPGFIDMHVHLREPGQENSETIESGTLAAARGGFTVVCCMPNTKPVNDNASITRFIVDRAKAHGHVHVWPIGAASVGSKGENIADIAAMREAGIVAVSDDGKPIATAKLARQVMDYCRSLNSPSSSTPKTFPWPLVQSCAKGSPPRVSVFPGMPAAAESVCVARDVQVAELTDARLHIAHLSAKASLDQVRFAKQQGLHVTCEVTPHHFTLIDEDVTYDSRFKMNPPLAARQDREALLQGLADGTVDAIATDHAPHEPAIKDVEFDKAPFGILGFETALALSLEQLVHTGKTQPHAYGRTLHHRSRSRPRQRTQTRLRRIQPTSQFFPRIVPGLTTSKTPPANPATRLSTAALSKAVPSLQSSPAKSSTTLRPNGSRFAGY